MTDSSFYLAHPDPDEVEPETPADDADGGEDWDDDFEDEGEDWDDEDWKEGEDVEDDLKD